MKTLVPTLMTLLLATGCGDWPTHSHISNADSTAISVNEHPNTGIEIDWVDAGAEIEPNDAHGLQLIHHDRLTTLDHAEGIETHGELKGFGWDDAAEPEQNSECGAPLAFPPDSTGDYRGDVEWIAIEASTAGTLCAFVELDDEDVAFDLTMYVLDECGGPVEVFIDEGRPIGIERSGGVWSAGVTIPADTLVGVALGGYSPNDLDLSVPWRLTLAMVPAVKNVDLCPARK